MTKRRGRNENSIYKRPDGYWVASASCGYDNRGKRIRVVAYGKTKQEARDKLAAKLAKPTPDEEITVAGLIDAWLAVKKTSVANGTYVRYEQIARLHVIPWIGGKKVHELLPIHVERFYFDILEDETASTARKAGEVLFMALKYAVHPRRLIAYNPCSDIPRPKIEPPEMTVWTPEEVAAFLELAATDRFYSLYLTALTTGMRSGELFALQWTDVNFEQSTVHVQRALEEVGGKLAIKKPKTRAGKRHIELPQITVEALHDRRKEAMADGFGKAPVWCDTRGGWLRRPNLKRDSFGPLMDKAEVKRIRFHDLRHTAATLLLLQGVQPKVVSERLGHAKVEITLNTYSHVLPTIQKEAAQKLDRLFA